MTQLALITGRIAVLLSLVPALGAEEPAYTRQADVIYGRKYGMALTMDILQPKIDAGDIKIASGETNFKTVATLRWDAARAKPGAMARRASHIPPFASTAADTLAGMPFISTSIRTHAGWPGQ